MEMYPDPDKYELLQRLRLATTLAEEHTQLLYELLQQPKKERARRKKEDGSAITKTDFDINNESRDTWQKLFPNDSFHGEEAPSLNPSADFAFLEDPVDNTNHFSEFDSKVPTKKKWTTYMGSIAFQGTPVAFTLGVPLLKQVYSGSVHWDVHMNGQPFYHPVKKPKILIGVNESEHEQELMQLIGYKDVHIAGVCAWLILQGVTLGGFCKFPLPHEATCIASIARSLKATVTNVHGQQFQPYNKMEGMVWSFPPQDHGELLEKIRQQ